MAEGLREYLRAAREKPFIWGTFDCCIFGADWVLLQTGSDPMADLRGTYQSETEANRIIEDNGGLIALLDRRMQRSDDPLVGVLSAPNQMPAVAIRNGLRWSILTPDTLATVRAGILGATVIGYR